MKIQYCDKTGLLFLDGVAFTIERLENVIKFFEYSHSQFYSTVMIFDKVNTEEDHIPATVTIKPSHIERIKNAMSMYNIASDSHFEVEPKISQPTYKYQYGSITIQSNCINELKEFAEEFGNLAKHLNDVCFDIDMDYQRFYNLDEDNWDIVHK